MDVYKDAREKGSLPVEIRDAVIKRRDARAKRDYRTADALQKLIEKANYKSVLASLYKFHWIILSTSLIGPR